MARMVAFHRGRVQSKDSLFPRICAVLAKVTAKNQLTLPKSITNEIGPVEYFDVVARNGQVVLTPVRIQRADAVRAKLAELDLTEEDVRDAVIWAREGSATPRTGKK